MIRSFLVHADGSVSVLPKKPMTQERQSKVPEIIEKMKAGKSAEAMRLIAIEIVGLITDIRECKNEAELQACDGSLKNLRALSASIVNTEALVERDDDVLNLDGPKFQFLFGEIVKSFKKAAADALGKGNEVKLNKIVEQVNSRIEAAMPEFRRRIETIGLDTRTDTSKGG